MLSDKYPAVLNFLICPSVMEEAIHLPPPPNPNIFRKLPFSGEEECLGVRARTEGNELAEGEGMGKGEETLSLYRDGKSFCTSPLAW